MTLFEGYGWPEPPRRRRTGLRVFLWILALATAGVLAYVFLNPVRIADQIAVWSYRPTREISDFTTRATMTDDARFLFYAAHPELQVADDFNSACVDDAEEAVTLGCYVLLDRRIHLFDVTDERLDGLQVVTAAHEMLHAAWHRMSAGDRARLAPLLEAESERLSADPAFVERMSVYSDVSGEDRLSELHSILGTEYAPLSDALEAHYAVYFSDRVALVALHDASESVFTALQTRSAQLSADLEALRTSIDADTVAFTSGRDQLDADIDAFNARWDAGGSGSSADFDAERAALIARQGSLETLRASIDSRRADWDTKAAELKAANGQIADLNASIDSRAPAPLPG